MADCKAALGIDGLRYDCDVQSPHPGVAHFNEEAKAHWCSDGEARASLRRMDASAHSG